MTATQEPASGLPALPPPARVVVWQPAYLGDVVFASPLTQAIAIGWPTAEIVFVARPPGDEVAAFLPGVSRVIRYDKRGADRGLAGARRVSAELGRLAPDLWLSLHGSIRSGLFARASTARSMGPSGELGSLLFDRRVSVRGESFPGRSIAIAASLGLAAEPRLRLELPAELRERGRATAGEGAVALVPGSEWETKRWPVERVAALARGLLARGAWPLLLGSPAEGTLCAEIARRAPGCRNLCGNTVTEALAILAACRTVVGGDSGLVHAARGLGVRTAVLFGPTDPLRHVAAATDTFISLGLDCSPCSDHGARRCPLGHQRCLADLTADRVVGEL